jgi:hypothetical protein
MQKHSTIVVLSIAGLVTSVGAGIAAIGNEVAGYMASPTTVPTEPQAVTEVLMPAESTVAVETTAPAEMPAAQITQTQVPLTPVERMAPALTTEPQRIASRTKDDEYLLRVPFTNRQVRVTVPTFPGNSAEYPDPSPAVVAYFDRKNANTVLVGAPGSAFPSGAGDDSHQISPAVVAYFDRMEARRLAAIQQATPTVAAAPPTVSSDTVVATVSDGTVR